MIFVIATLQTTEENRQQLISASQICIEATRREDGCLSYDLHQSVSDPNTLVFVERWQDRQALEAHFATPHLSAWREAARPLVVDKSVEIIQPEAIETL
ncbi:putative quinol monooxygenase [Labrenzia sp. VG12]|uniref:putative quinol monooxygenase n=1 Tax=Labrenzia sp. VG12 TaxID=2021862 RepID=UPI000B8C2E19|nr:putative quinol monooxygenase [Labrenzia sp. VG12]ASP32540.1 antibiotic biosynthesis monooxygenase [Labrenzia sp. VG12]